MQAGQSILDRIQRRYDMNTFLERKIIFVDRRRLTSVYRMVGGEQEDINNHRRTN